MKQNYMNTDKAKWKEPKLTTLISEVGSGTNIQSKQAHILKNRNRRLRLSPTVPKSPLCHIEAANEDNDSGFIFILHVIVAALRNWFTN